MMSLCVVVVVVVVGGVFVCVDFFVYKKRLLM